METIMNKYLVLSLSILASFPIYLACGEFNKTFSSSQISGVCQGSIEKATFRRLQARFNREKFFDPRNKIVIQSPQLNREKRPPRRPS